MTVFNSDEKQYLVSILKKHSGSKYKQYINIFINDFIAKFIYNKLFNIDNNEMDVREKIKSFNEKKEEFIVNKDSVKEIFFDAFPETIGRQSSCNIIEIINRNYNILENDKLMMYLSIRTIFFNLFGKNHLLFNLDDKKYIQIIEYKFFNFNYTDISKLKEFCHQLIIEIINIYIFSDKQAIDCTDEEHSRLSQYKNNAIGIFDIYMSEDIINGYKNEFPFNKNIYIEEIYDNIYYIWVNYIINDTNEINIEEINQQLETIEQINTKIDSEIKSINTNLSPKQLNFLVEGLIELGCIDEKNKGDLIAFLGIQNRKQSINTIKWKKSKMLCAYFVDKFNCDILNKDRIIWKPFEALFSQSKLVDSRNHYRNKTGDKPMGYKDINVLFEKILKE
jgi:hypothetical protein